MRAKFYTLFLFVVVTPFSFFDANAQSELEHVMLALEKTRAAKNSFQEQPYSTDSALGAQADQFKAELAKLDVALQNVAAGAVRDGLLDQRYALVIAAWQSSQVSTEYFDERVNLINRDELMAYLNALPGSVFSQELNEEFSDLGGVLQSLGTVFEVREYRRDFYVYNDAATIDLVKTGLQFKLDQIAEAVLMFNENMPNTFEGLRITYNAYVASIRTRTLKTPEAAKNSLAETGLNMHNWATSTYATLEDVGTLIEE